jgi:hypothetical protein
VYHLDLPREWVIKAAPLIKLLSGTLSLILPVASSATKLILDDSAYQRIENELNFGMECAEALLKGGEQAANLLGSNEDAELGQGEAIRAEAAVLRQLHAWLKDKDPGFGGLSRVMNKQQAFLWVHPQFASEY